MKVIIAGSRSITNHNVIINSIYDSMKESGFEITEVVSGMAKGVDTMAAWWATSQKLPLKKFYPDYAHRSGKIAPILRNTEMALYADALIAIWDGESRGTKHMIEYMRDKMMKPVFVKVIKNG